MKKVKQLQQLDLFSEEYAESGNIPQLSSMFGAEPPAEKCNTDGRFSSLPAAGYRNNNGGMNNQGSNGNYWTSTPNSSNNAYYLNFNSGNLNVNNNNRNNGQSLRCLQEFTQEAVLSSFSSYQADKQTLLEDLIGAYRDARKHKRNTRNQMQFELNLEENLIELRNELINRTYKVGRSTCFIIEDPVKREIFAADFRDRVVHHLVYNYISPMFEPTFIADSYSCRKGKGTLYGIHRLQHHIRSCSCNYKHPCYALKMDIQGYFMNIRRSKLLQTVTGELQKKAFCMEGGKGVWISRLDYSLIHYLMEEIIMTDPTKNCIIKGSKSDWNGLPPNKSLFHTPEDCGLPIGNLTSQLFSNIYLNSLDQYIKRTLHEKHYGRYVDDSFLVNRSYSHLKERMTNIRTYLEDELGLVLHPKKTSITRVNYGINYLGVFVKPYRLYIHNKTARRMKRKIAAFRQCTDTELLRSCVNSCLGYLKHLKCGKLKRKWIEGNKFLFDHGYFNDDYSKFILYTEKQLTTDKKVTPVN